MEWAQYKLMRCRPSGSERQSGLHTRTWASNVVPSPTRKYLTATLSSRKERRCLRPHEGSGNTRRRQCLTGCRANEPCTPTWSLLHRHQPSSTWAIFKIHIRCSTDAHEARYIRGYNHTSVHSPRTLKMRRTMSCRFQYSKIGCGSNLASQSSWPAPWPLRASQQSFDAIECGSPRLSSQPFRWHWLSTRAVRAA